MTNILNSINKKTIVQAIKFNFNPLPELQMTIVLLKIQVSYDKTTFYLAK